VHKASYVHEVKILNWGPSEKMSLYRRSLNQSEGLKVKWNLSGGLEGAPSEAVHNVNIYIISDTELQDFFSLVTELGISQLHLDFFEYQPL